MPADLQSAPLLYVVEDWAPDMENGNDPPVADPWCLGCGGRIADGPGLEQHASWHGFQRHEYQLVTETVLRQRGWL